MSLVSYSEAVVQIEILGAKVYLGCRSLEKAKRAVEDIQRETGISADRMPIIRLDLASLKSVREFVKQFRQSKWRLYGQNRCSFLSLQKDMLCALVTGLVSENLLQADFIFQWLLAEYGSTVWLSCLLTYFYLLQLTLPWEYFGCFSLDGFHAFWFRWLHSNVGISNYNLLKT